MVVARQTRTLRGWAMVALSVLVSFACAHTKPDSASWEMTSGGGGPGTNTLAPVELVAEHV